MRRTAVPGLVAAAVMTMAPAASARAGGPVVRAVDTSGYPQVRLTVLAPSAKSPAPVLRENSQRVPGSHSENLGAGKAIVLAIDQSRSMRGRPLVLAAQASRSFVDAKPHADRIALVTFGWRAVALTRFSQATIDAHAALRTVATDSRVGTALYDAVVLATAELRAQSLPGRVIVLLTDGHDLGSVATLADAIDAARAANAGIYVIALGRDARRPLERLARATGGHLYAAAPETLPAIYARIRAELSRTWRMTYPTSARPGERIALAVAVNGRTATASVRLPGHLDGGGRPGRIVAAWLSRGSGVVLLSLAVGALLFAALRLPRRHRDRDRIRRLLAVHDTADETAGPARDRGAAARRRLNELFAATDERMERLRAWKRIERLVSQAGSGLTAVQLVYAAGAAGVTAAAFIGLMTRQPLFTVVTLVIGAVAPFAAVSVAARRRVRAFDRQLPDALATIASSLKAGHGLKQALQGFVAGGDPPASVEFGRVLAEARFGRPLDEALASMCERLDSDDLRYVSTAVAVQTQVGGSLAGLFGTVAETVRQRQQHERKVRALTATGRASAAVLSLLPFILAGLLTLISPSYMVPFFSSSIGQVLTGASMLSIGIGALLLNRIVSVRE